MKRTMLEQTKEWTEAVAAQRAEEMALVRAQLDDTHALLKKLMVEKQGEQMKQLSAIFYR